MKKIVIIIQYLEGITGALVPILIGVVSLVAYIFMLMEKSWTCNPFDVIRPRQTNKESRIATPHTQNSITGHQERNPN